MSGVEVAGLVLGALPLLINGLQHYGEGVRTIRKMKNSSCEFLKLKQTLEVQHQIFLNCLEQLLKDDVDEQRLAAMLDSVEDVGWSDAEVDRCLRQRLGRSYAAYLGAVKAMAATMASVREALQLKADGKGPFSMDKVSVGEVLRRLRFGLKMKAYVELMDDIVGQNQALCQLVHQSRHLEPIRESRRRIPNFEKARCHAMSIFAALQRALISSCSTSHGVSFYMRSPEVPSLGNSRPNSSRYRVVLHHGPGGPRDAASRWSTEEAEICSTDDLESEGTGREVKFHITTAIVSAPEQLGIREIQDLCQAIQQLQTPSTRCQDLCLGYVSAGVDKCRHSLYCPQTPLLGKGCTESITLEEVLNAQHGHKLGESDKRFLALALASGMLRLHNTPWLEKQWGRKNVLLFKRRGRIVASHPFVSVDLGKAPQTQPADLYFTPSRPIKEESIFALGVLLIELAMEKPFEMLVGPEDLRPDGTKHELSDFYTADRLIDEVYLRAGDRYGDVVRRCVRCEFDHHKSSLTDAGFRRKVYEGVVAVLEMEVADLVNL